MAVTMASLVRDPEAWSDGVDTDTTCSREISTFVSRRRSSDKLNHFEHWAVKITKALPLAERLGHMKALLPAGLIGEHAMSHLKHRREFNADDAHRRFWRSPRHSTFLNRGELAQLLREIIVAPDGHRLLNSTLRQLHSASFTSSITERPAFRALRGLHDVLAFLDENATDHDLTKFCRIFKATRDPEAAAVATLPTPPNVYGAIGALQASLPLA